MEAAVTSVKEPELRRSGGGVLDIQMDSSVCRDLYSCTGRRGLDIARIILRRLRGLLSGPR